MLSAIALKTGTGPGTMVGENTAESTSHATSSETMERILGSVFIANEVCRDNLEDAVADNTMDEFQVIVLQIDLLRVPALHKVRSHLLPQQLPFGRIVHLDARRVFVPDLRMAVN